MLKSRLFIQFIYDWQQYYPCLIDKETKAEKFKVRISQRWNFIFNPGTVSEPMLLNYIPFLPRKTQMKVCSRMTSDRCCWLANQKPPLTPYSTMLLPPWRLMQCITVAFPAPLVWAMWMWPRSYKEKSLRLLGESLLSDKRDTLSSYLFLILPWHGHDS
jgi:hypothetical protein